MFFWQKRIVLKIAWFGEKVYQTCAPKNSRRNFPLVFSSTLSCLTFFYFDNYLLKQQWLFIKKFEEQSKSRAIKEFILIDVYYSNTPHTDNQSCWPSTCPLKLLRKWIFSSSDCIWLASCTNCRRISYRWVPLNLCSGRVSVWRGMGGGALEAF